MNRDRAWAMEWIDTAPRARGDEPFLFILFGLSGCLLPAHVGMNREEEIWQA